MNLLLTEDIKFILTNALVEYTEAMRTTSLTVGDEKRLADTRTWLEQQQPIRKEITNAHNNP